MRKNIVVVIPAKNEEKSIKKVIEEVYEVGRENGFENLKVLVVSDSDDNTNKIAESANALVVRGKGEGLGSAMHLGIKEAIKTDADVIVSIDADGQFDFQEMPKVIVPVLKGNADLVLGSRFLKPGMVEYPMPLINRVGNKVLSWMVRRISKFPITDAQTGYRAMTREVANSLEMIGTHTYVQETIIDAIAKNFRVMEVPVRFRKREHGKSKVVSSVKRYAIWTIIPLAIRAGLHMEIFTMLGISLLSAGILLAAYLFYVESFVIANLFKRIPALILVTLLVLTGLQMFFFGFLLNMIASIKKRIDRISD